MYFGVGIKNKIKELRSNGKHDEVKKELMRIRMSKYEKLNIQEKIDITYYLAWYGLFDANKELLYYYLNEISNIFEVVDKEDYRVEYYRYLWLTVNANYKDMEKESVVKAMMEVHDFYDEIGDKTLALSAICSIYGIYDDGDSVIETLKIIMNHRSNIDEITLNSLLDSLTDLNQELYIEAKNMIASYIEKSMII